MAEATLHVGRCSADANDTSYLDAIIFAFVSCILPSIPYFILSFFVCPVRIFPIALYFILAVAGAYLRLLSLIILAIIVAGIDLTIVVSGVFNLNWYLLLDSVRYLGTLDLFSFTGYILFASMILLFVALYVFLIVRIREKFKKVSLIPSILCCCFILIADVSMNLSSQSTLANTLRSGAKFSSAVSQTNLDSFSAIHPDQNVLVVMIEGMGAFERSAHQNLLWEIFDTPEIKSRFEVATGTGPYKGSTTSAESRELCGRWGDYYDYLEEREFDCLPAQYRDNGYETAAFHAFGGDLFQRKTWFPRIGFEKLFFKEQLEGSRHLPENRVCGLTFRGLCDLDVADVVESYLLKPSKKLKFSYWLTLNTHLPVEPGAATNRLNCGNETLFDDWTVCYITEMWMDVLYRVREIALNPKLQNTQILLVGDHHPPVWTRQGRGLFVPGRVAWLHLKPNASMTREDMASTTITQ